jgi:hypothetical protein
MVDTRRRKGRQVIGESCIRYRVSYAFTCQILEPLSDRARSGPDTFLGDKPDPQGGLPLEHSDQIRIGHRGQWVVPLRRLRYELGADEEVTLKHAPSSFREGRSENRQRVAGKLG